MTDKTIKLWRLKERSKRPLGYNIPPPSPNAMQVVNGNGNASSSGDDSPPKFKTSADLCVPHFEPTLAAVIEASPRRLFANAHAYLINSLSVNSDQETFLSADDLRINLWNLQVPDCSFNIVDIKPELMGDLVEVITAAQFHPSACSLFVYSSSRGTIRLCDMRERALCDRQALTFEDTEELNANCFFAEIVSSVSDLSFSHSGRYLASRDYLTVKIWDTHMPKLPVRTYNVHDYFRKKLCNLYENDLIFDKFECRWSPDDRYIVTGSYNNQFKLLSTWQQDDSPSLSSSDSNNNDFDQLIELTSDLSSPSPSPLPLRRIHDDTLRDLDYDSAPDLLSVDSLDMRAKLLHVAWQPHNQSRIAFTSQNRLYFLHNNPDGGDAAVSSGDKPLLGSTTTTVAMDVDRPPVTSSSDTTNDMLVDQPPCLSDASSPIPVASAVPTNGL